MWRGLIHNITSSAEKSPLSGADKVAGVTGMGARNLPIEDDGLFEALERKHQPFLKANLH